MIVAQSPQLLGIGVDEDTCAVITEDPGVDGPHELLRVLGRGSVTILDPARIVSNAHEAKRSSPLLASGVVLHVLPAGSAFDLTTRTLLPAAAAGRPRGRRRARRGAARHAPAGPRHRGRGRQPGRAA